MAALFFLGSEGAVDLDFVRLECEIIVDTSAQLSAALYNTLRVFEAEFKSSSCLTLQESCTTCRQHAGCPYQLVFGRQLSSDPDVVRLHQKPSLPFSLYISEIDGNTSYYTLGLVIVGIAVNYIEFFFSALIRIIEAALSTILPPVKYSLHSHSLDYNNVRHEIRNDKPLTESVILLSGQHILRNTIHSDTINILLKSTLRLLDKGTISRSFDFGLFFRSQLRRCSSLWAYYGNGVMELDYMFLSASAQNVTVYDDKIHFSKPSWSKSLNGSGLTGTAKCAGLLEPMYSLLLLGSYFNAGKGASFGSGFHQLEVL